ncbi:lipoprotein yfgL [Candidatus Photodesmus katoptron]|uniref:outer membrane protein assembly factor BamB n=1 Tax=Candidatus Photodesmus anomalopis TaxID=28176 RepID=UPI0004D405E3|nr:outer membrane protein assembly factor BamB [Candidatus Photodesmus katoptron]KEY89982.1 lipoprotein yfgL [Candidatus Photodesmus katoptron]
MNTKKRIGSIFILIVCMHVFLSLGCVQVKDLATSSFSYKNSKNEIIQLQEWKTSVGEGVGYHISKLSPKYAYGKIYIASRSGLVKALDPKNGHTLWETSLEENNISARLSGGISAAYGKLFIGSENGKLISLDAQTGKLIWNVRIGSELLTVPVTSNNMVIVNTNQGMLLSLDQQTGQQNWIISTTVPNISLRGDSVPVIGFDTVFWGTTDGFLAAANLEQGKLIWKKAIRKTTSKKNMKVNHIVDIDASPLLLGNTIFVIGVNTQLVAIDLNSGQFIWESPYSSEKDIQSDGNRIFITTDNNCLVAVDIKNGNEIWKNEQLRDRVVTDPKIIKEYLVVGDNKGYLHWIDRRTGEFITQYRVHYSGFSVGPIELPEGYLLTTRNGEVRKFKIN